MARKRQETVYKGSRPSPFINHDAFDDLEDPLALYYLGLLVADGSIGIYKGGHCCSLKVAIEDEAMLRGAQAFFNVPEDKLYFRAPESEEQQEQIGFRFHSKRIYEALHAAGLRQRKSFDGMRLREDLATQAAVWLGVFDGDGSLWFQTEHGGPALEMTGCREVMEQFAAWGAAATGRLDAPIARQRKEDNSWRAVFYSAEAQRLGEILLAALPQSLERKRLRLAEAIAWQPEGGEYLLTNRENRLDDTPRREKTRRGRARRRILWSGEGTRYESSRHQADFTQILTEEGFINLRVRRDLSEKRALLEGEKNGETVIICCTTSQTYLPRPSVRAEALQGTPVFILHLSPARDVHCLQKMKNGSVTRVPLPFLKTLAPWPDV